MTKNLPYAKDDIVWIPYLCKECGATTNHLKGAKPQCANCAVQNASCLCEGISVDDDETLLAIRKECASNGCNICLSKIEEDTIKWPKHYNMGKIQPIDAIESWDLDFRLANVVKYIARAGKKDPSKKREDLKKALWYLNRFIDKECP